MTDNDLTYWLTLVERYFDAQTTESEEAQLLRYLASDASRTGLTAEQQACFDEARAVMGIAATQRVLARTEASAARSGARLRILRRAIAVAAAACLVGAAFIIGLRQWYSVDIHIAYIDGQEVKERELVMSAMRQSWSNIDYSSDDDNVRATLQDMFNELN